MGLPHFLYLLVLVVVGFIIGIWVCLQSVSNLHKFVEIVGFDRKSIPTNEQKQVSPPSSAPNVLSIQSVEYLVPAHLHYLMRHDVLIKIINIVRNHHEDLVQGRLPKFDSIVGKLGL